MKRRNLLWGLLSVPLALLGWRPAKEPSQERCCWMGKREKMTFDADGFVVKRERFYKDRQSGVRCCQELFDRDGHLHCDDGPATVGKLGDRTYVQEWRRHGMLYRENGPVGVYFMRYDNVFCVTYVDETGGIVSKTFAPKDLPPDCRFV